MKFLRYLGALVFPERCPFCGKIVEPLESACPDCLDEIRRKHLPIKSGARGFRCVSSFVYDGKVRRLILRIKYQNRTQFIPQIAEILAGDIKEVYGDAAFDIITAVPMFKDDLRKREYNQAELLARATGKLLGIPYADTLHKVKRTKKQHTLKYNERKTNLNGAFLLIEKEPFKDKRILIIDDIVTSGYTLGNCCKTLTKSKPALICCATIACAQNKYPESTAI